MVGISLRILGSKKRHTLLDLLSAPLERFPVPRTKDNASSTTNGGIKDSQSEIEDSGTLQGVVFVPDLLESSINEATKVAKKFVLKNSSEQHALYASSIHAKYTQAWNTPQMNSEQDTREWAHVCYVRPALAALHAIINASNEPKTNEIDIDIQKSVYVSSGFSMKRDGDLKAGPIMDSFMANGPWVQGADPEMRMTAEYKSCNAMKYDTFNKVTSAGELGIKKHSLIPIYCPDENDIGITKDSKIFCQVYRQMSSSNVQFSWLSSYTTNIFFYKKKGGTELYMSKPYDLASTTPLVIFSWFCRASGLLKSDMNIPIPDYSYYHKIKRLIHKTPYRHGVMAFSDNEINIILASATVGSSSKRQLPGTDDDDDNDDNETTPKQNKITVRPIERKKRKKHL